MEKDVTKMPGTKWPAGGRRPSSYPKMAVVMMPEVPNRTPQTYTIGQWADYGGFEYDLGNGYLFPDDPKVKKMGKIDLPNGKLTPEIAVAALNRGINAVGKNDDE